MQWEECFLLMIRTKKKSRSVLLENFLFNPNHTKVTTPPKVCLQAIQSTNEPLLDFQKCNQPRSVTNSCLWCLQILWGFDSTLVFLRILLSLLQLPQKAISKAISITATIKSKSICLTLISRLHLWYLHNQTIDNYLKQKKNLIILTMIWMKWILNSNDSELSEWKVLHLLFILKITQWHALSNPRN